MSWTLVNNTSYFTLTESGGEIHDIYPTDIRQLYLRGIHVWIVYSQREPDNNNIVESFGTNTLKLLASDFTSPTYATAALLKAGLLAIIATMSTTSILLDILAGIEDLSDGYHNLIGKSSGGDFDTSYNDATSLDCDSMPDTHTVLIVDDIEAVKQRNAAGEVVEIYTSSETAMVVTNPVGSTYRITIAAATFGATDTFTVYTNVSVNRLTVKTLGLDTYTEAVTNGNIIGAVRNDAGTTLVDTDGEFAPLMVNATGMLNVNLDQVRDTAPEIGAGNAGGGTLRVSIATDDVNLAAINEATVGLGTIAVVTNAAVGVAAEQLVVASTPCKRTFVTAHPDNTGRITVGGSGVTDGNGVVLYAADTVEIQIDDVNKLYVIASVADEDVSATYLT